ncbi:MAG: beta-propeller domain-containing protein [Candidatus Bathyarchaeota archaeon]|nr:MAG: beta-propeller domain-containing protein [Candidatus Bathyarchaeota archaeon]
MKKVVFFIVSVTVIVGALAPLYLEGELHYYSSLSPLKKFSSYEELKSFVNASSQAHLYYFEGTRSEFFEMRALSATTAGRSAKGHSVPDYSTTNIQVAGVDEADVVKTDGEYIYVVSNKSVVIVKAYPAEEAEVISKIDLDGALRGIFINGDRLAVFEDEGHRVFIKVYDISDRTDPIQARNDSLDGRYFNSRMIGDYVYVVISQPAYLQEDEVALPKIYSNDGVKEISATDIYYSDIPDYSYTFTTIVAVNVQNDDEEPTVESFLLGATSNMYVSLNNIYITLPENDKTLVYRIHIKGNQIDSAASGEVPGRVLNQFSMDEHEGYFRIATTTGHVWRGWGEMSSKNHVYVLDMNLTIVGRLEDLASGETIYSARFMGGRCYLVTFKKVDPLFVIDLEDPRNPRVLGQLKITGYSNYLHPYDENHVIGIGKETVAAEEGNFAWYQGVKISLFDVSDVENPKEIDKYEIGDRGTSSPVLSDHKALLFDKSKNLLVIPVLVAEIDEEKYLGEIPPYTHGDYVWQGAYVFDISLDEGLVLKGGVTHLEDDNGLMKSGYYFSSPYSVKRSLYIDNMLYTISDKKVKMNSLENLEEINEVELL